MQADQPITVQELPIFSIEIWLAFCQWFSPDQLALFGLTCRRAHQISSDDFLWKNFLEHPAGIMPGETAKSTFIGKPALRKLQYVELDKKGKVYIAMLEENIVTHVKNGDHLLSWIRNAADYKKNLLLKYKLLQLANTSLRQVNVTRCVLPPRLNTFVTILQTNLKTLEEIEHFMSNLWTAIARHGFDSVDSFLHEFLKPQNALLRNDKPSLGKLWEVIFNCGFGDADQLVRTVASSAVKTLATRKPKIMEIIWKVITKQGCHAVEDFTQVLATPAALALLDDERFLSGLMNHLIDRPLFNPHELVTLLVKPQANVFLASAEFMRRIWYAQKYESMELQSCLHELCKPEAEKILDNNAYTIELRESLLEHGFHASNCFIVSLLQREAQVLLENTNLMNKIWQVIRQHGFYQADMFVFDIIHCWSTIIHQQAFLDALLDETVANGFVAGINYLGANKPADMSHAVQPAQSAAKLMPFFKPAEAAMVKAPPHTAPGLLQHFNK